MAEIVCGACGMKITGATMEQAKQNAMEHKEKEHKDMKHEHKK